MPHEAALERPAKRHRDVDLKAEQALGLTIPQPLLLRADEVIQ